MKELYFPTIRIQVNNWLKYALLYKKSLYTIKPTQYSNVSYDYLNERIGDSFLQAYDPERFFNLSDQRGNNLEDLIIHYLIQVNRFPREFKLNPHDLSHQYKNTLDYALREEPKNSELFRGKYTRDIQDFITDNQYGELSQNGRSIMVSNRFATIYMGLMAEHIAGMDSEVVLTTQADTMRAYQMNNNILNQGRIPRIWNSIEYNDDPRLTEFRNQVVDLFLPVNIQDIAIESIGELRRQRDYEQNLKRFNQLIELLYTRSLSHQSTDDIIAEIYDTTELLKWAISSKLGGILLETATSALLSATNAPFLMSEGIARAVSSVSDTLNNRHPEFISPLVGHGAIKFFYNLESLNGRLG